MMLTFSDMYSSWQWLRIKYVINPFLNIFTHIVSLWLPFIMLISFSFHLMKYARIVIKVRLPLIVITFSRKHLHHPILNFQEYLLLEKNGWAFETIKSLGEAYTFHTDHYALTNKLKIIPQTYQNIPKQVGFRFYSRYCIVEKYLLAIKSFQVFCCFISFQTLGENYTLKVFSMFHGFSLILNPITDSNRIFLLISVFISIMILIRIITRMFLVGALTLSLYLH